MLRTGDARSFDGGKTLWRTERQLAPVGAPLPAAFGQPNQQYQGIPTTKLPSSANEASKVGPNAS